MEYGKMLEASRILKEFAKQHNIAIVTTDEKLMTAIHMKELEEKNKESNYGAMADKLMNTVDICLLPCSPIIKEEFTGFKPNTIYILKNRG